MEGTDMPQSPALINATQELQPGQSLSLRQILDGTSSIDPVDQQQAKNTNAFCQQPYGVTNNNNYSQENYHTGTQGSEYLTPQMQNEQSSCYFSQNPTTPTYNSEFQASSGAIQQNRGQVGQEDVMQPAQYYAAPPGFVQNVSTSYLYHNYAEQFQGRTFQYPPTQYQVPQQYYNMSFNPNPNPVLNAGPPNFCPPNVQLYNPPYLEPSSQNTTHLKGMLNSTPTLNFKFGTPHIPSTSLIPQEKNVSGLPSQYYSGGTVLQGMNNGIGQSSSFLFPGQGMVSGPVYGFGQHSFGTSNQGAYTGNGTMDNFKTPMKLNPYAFDSSTDAYGRGNNNVSQAQAQGYSYGPNPTMIDAALDVEDKVYFEKIQELQRFTSFLIEKIGNEEIEKSSKIKTLLEVLSNRNQRVSMSALAKCEYALRRMEQAYMAGITTGPPRQHKMSPVPFQQFVGAVNQLNKCPDGLNTWKRSIQPPFEQILEQTYENESSDSDTEPEKTPELKIPWVLEKEFRFISRTRFGIKLIRRPEQPKILNLHCALLDKNLPNVPQLKLKIDSSYPDICPEIMGMTLDYNSCDYLASVHRAFQTRLASITYKYTVTEILNVWESSVRYAANPKFKY